MKHALLALVLAGCPEPAANPCGDGLFCPVDTTCGGEGVCVVDSEACGDFPDDTPCVRDLQRGFCLAGACDAGVIVIGATETFPLRTFPDGVQVRVIDRPEILGAVTNPNGYFDVVTPRDTDIVLELSYPDALPVRTRTIAVGVDDVLADEIYGAIPIVLDDIARSIADLIGQPLDPANGMISGATFDPANRLSVEGVVVTADGGCRGPYYFDETGPVLDATATVQTGVFVFFDCPPGPVTVSATLGAIACTAIDPVPLQIEVGARMLSHVGRVICQ
jgi:hypothetical protein